MYHVPGDFSKPKNSDLTKGSTNVPIVTGDFPIADICIYIIYICILLADIIIYLCILIIIS